MFLTAAAQNLLCLKLASEMGVAISSPWVTWLKGAIAPALCGLLITPLLIYKVCSRDMCGPVHCVREPAVLGHVVLLRTHNFTKICMTGP